MATPRKRDREEDEDEEDTSPSLWSSVIGLFSTAKKKPKRQRTAEESSTPATHLPRLNLSTPSAHVSPPAETTGTPPAPLTAATSTPARAPAIEMPPARAAPSPWQAAPIQFTPGPLVLSSRRRLTRYRPLSRTLVQVPRRRQRPTRTEYNAELVARVLEQSQDLFRPQENGYTTTSVPGRRQMGTNQRGSRLAAAPAARKQVSFEEPRLRESSQVATTPHVPRRTSQKRVTTPYVAPRPQESPAPSDEDIEEELVQEEQETLPVDYAAMPRPAVSRDSEFIFDYPVDYKGDASRGTLVAWKKPFSTLSVTSVPPPGRDPRHVFQTAQEVPEEETSAQAPPAEESPKDEQPTPKKIRTEGWGNLFPETTPGWKCETCLLINQPEYDKCNACEAPRPGTGTASVVGGSAAGGNDGSGGAAVGGTAASGGSIGTGGFRFGVGEETKESIEESKEGFKFGITEGGFSFGKTDKSETPKPTGFSFPKPKGAKEDVLKPESEKEVVPETPARVSFEIKPPAKSEPPKFSFGETPAAEAPKFSFGATPAAEAPKFPFGATPAAEAPKFSFGTTPAPEAPKFSFGTTPASDTATEGKRPSGGFHFGAKPETGESATKKLEFSKPSETGKGGGSTVPSSSVVGTDSAATNSMGPPPNKPFQFGTAAPATGDSSKFSFSFGGATGAPSAPPVITKAQTMFGSAPALDSSASASAPAPAENDGRREKRRSPPDDHNEEKSEEKESTSARPFVFGATPATAAGKSDNGAPAFSGSQGGASFGSMPARTGDVQTFGMTPAPATTQPTFTFGSTPAATTPAAPSFGAPANAVSAPSTGFGQNGGSNPFGTNAAPSFGPSATTPAPAAPAFNFGASTAAPVAPTFGTPAPPPPSQDFSFGSTPMASSVAPFGATMATAPAPGGFSFGTTPAPAGGGFSFGGTSAQAATTPGFGGQTTMPAPTPGFGGFGATPGTGGFSATPGFSGFGATPGTGGFGATPGTGGFGATPGAPPIIPAAGGFSIGSGGGGGRSGASTGRRRFIKAKRPPGSGSGMGR